MTICEFSQQKQTSACYIFSCCETLLRYQSVNQWWKENSNRKKTVKQLVESRLHEAVRWVGHHEQ